MSKLKDISHKAYNIENIRYVNFICKNPNVKKKEFIEDKNKAIHNDKISHVGLYYGKNNMIYLTTPVMTCPFGVNQSNGFIMNLQFTNYENDDKMKEFYLFIKSLEELQKNHIGIDDDNDDLYISQIKRDKNNKYDPNLVVKLPFRQNRFELEAYNKEGEHINILNIPKFCKVQCDIYIDKIWKFNDQYVCKWKLYKLIMK